MHRLAVLLLALALLAAACGGSPDAGGAASTDAPVTTEASTDGTVAPESTTGDGPTSSEGSTDETVAAGPPVSGVDGPPAPPNLVPFEGGADIDLGQEVLPVYLVFWAEW